MLRLSSQDRQRLHTLHENTHSSTTSDQAREQEFEEHLEHLMKEVEFEFTVTPYTVHSWEDLNRRMDEMEHEMARLEAMRILEGRVE